MDINKTKKYTHIKPASNTIKDFFITFSNKFSQFNKEHLIIDFSEKINTKIEEINLFLNLSESHRNNSKSFVIISNGIDIDEIPDEIIVVPTFKEAIDVLEMDAIERDLGF
jgi:hypothetical protein